MAALQKFGRLSSLLFSRGSRLYSTPSKVSPPKVVIEDYPPWPELWLPGPFPKTEAERIKAAERYGLHPDEYKPFPEEEGCGDYPNVKLLGYDARDPYYPWDIPAQRRNFNETIPEDADNVGVEKYASYGTKDAEDDTKAGIVGWVTFLGCLVVLYFGFGDTHVRLMEKHYLEPGVRHYSFEPASK